MAAAAEAGMDPPQSAVPPDLPESLTHYVIDFWNLTTCRHYHQGGPGPIPWTAMDQYAERNGYAANVDVYEEFSRFMNAMDQAYLEHFSEESTKARKAAERKSSQPSKSKW